jgi:hypothetical protein
MPPLKPQNGTKKHVVVTTILPSKNPRKSFFEEYYYSVLAAEFVCLTLLFAGGGMGFYQGTLVGLLFTATTAVAWQFRQYLKFKGQAVKPDFRTAFKPTLKPLLKPLAAKPELQPIRPAKRPPVPVGPDGKKKFPPSYFPPLRDRKPPQ